MRRYNKYSNRKTTIDGYTFDSKKEAERYGILRLLEKQGDISDLTLQPQFELQPKFIKNGKTFRPIVYRADFCYFEGKQFIVEDVKGFKTGIFKIKRKMFEFKFPKFTLKITK